MAEQNKQLKEALNKSQSVEEMTMNLISDYYKLKLALVQIKSQLTDRGGNDILIEGINETLKIVQ